MFGGWLAGLGVYGGSHLYAQRQAPNATARAQYGPMDNQEEIKASRLPGDQPDGTAFTLASTFQPL